MAQVKIICCKWIHGKPKWLFGVDKGKKSKIIPVNHKTSYEEFVHMVIRAHNVDTEIYDVELSYMYPKKVLLTLPQKTPPIDIGNQRQFNGFLEQAHVVKIGEDRAVREANGQTEISNSIDLFAFHSKKVPEL
ncbi:hypothetical protein Bca4012_006812 [Brassica carinata]